jgi:ParB family chromosome partitioning protein
MNSVESLDLSALAQFKASSLLAETDRSPNEVAGKPLQLDVLQIDFDAAQPRRTISEMSISELAQSIRLHGVLEPISVRSHAKIQGRYVVNRGERRLRACRMAGLDRVPAFLDERHDPYAQAAENLHREDMSPFDLAQFIAEREREGQARAEIARRLGKPRSFITEVAALIDAPAPVREAFDQGRLGADLRVMYRLAGAMKGRPVETSVMLARAGPISRANVDALLAEMGGAQTGAAGHAGRDASARSARVASAGRTVLVVEHGGRRGSLRLKAHDKDVGEVRFGDGSRTLVRLSELRPLCWATEE